MRFRFNPAEPLILVNATITGPSGVGTQRCVLDTGASRTMLHPAFLANVGYEPETIPADFLIAAANGMTHVRRLTLGRIAALGHARGDHPIICHALPVTSGFHGLPGLDFLRGHPMTLDMVEGSLELV